MVFAFPSPPVLICVFSAPQAVAVHPRGCRWESCDERVCLRRLGPAFLNLFCTCRVKAVIRGSSVHHQRCVPVERDPVFNLSAATHAHISFHFLIPLGSSFGCCGSPPTATQTRHLHTLPWHRIYFFFVETRSLFWLLYGGPDYSLFTGTRKHNDNLAAFKHFKHCYYFSI